MKVFVTGATGFVGTRLVGRLLERGERVVALARSPASAQKLADRGLRFVQGSLTAGPAIRTGVEGADAVLHVAGDYRIGITRSERQAMYQTNVLGTQSVLEAALAAGVGRTVYVSTINVFGNTHGLVVDEGYVRPGRDFLSYCDETKFRAHELALEQAEKGAPVVIVQPGQIYGRNDHSIVGAQLAQAWSGALRHLVLAEVGLNFVHVDDVVEGILAALEHGSPGESYVLGGEIARLGEAIDRAAKLGGKPAPERAVPRWLVKALVPLGPLVARMAGLPPNVAEVVRATDHVTYWARDDKARRDLGYAPRRLEAGLSDVFGST